MFFPDVLFTVSFLVLFVILSKCILHKGQKLRHEYYLNNRIDLSCALLAMNVLKSSFRPIQFTFLSNLRLEGENMRLYFIAR